MPTVEEILAYFGTYTPGVDGAVSSFKFEYLTSLGFAAIVIFLGHAIVKRSALLRKFAIPAPVVSGLLFSIVIAILKGSGLIAISFNVSTIQDLCQNIFFMCVGFGFSWKLIRHAGGKLCLKIAIAACLLITLQDVLGVLVGQLIGLNPFLALQCSSSAMSGGVGTAASFGPIFIEKMGAPESATAVGVTAGTLGNVMGSLIGGPVAAFLISRHGLKSDPNDKPESAVDGKINELSNSRMVSMFGMVLLLCALGMPIYCILDNIPMIEMPKFIGCLFAGAIARKVMEALNIKFYTPEVDAIEHVRPGLRCGCHGGRQLRLGLRLRTQRRGQREGGHGSVWLAQCGLGALPLLRRDYRRHLQPDFPLFVRKHLCSLNISLFLQPLRGAAFAAPRSGFCGFFRL